MVCPNCKKRLDGQEKFCPYCGKRMMSGEEEDRDSSKTSRVQVKICTIIISVLVIVAVLSLCVSFLKFMESLKQNSLFSYDFSVYDVVGQKLSDIEKPYLNEQGFVSFDDAKTLREEAFDYIQTLYAQGTITDCAYTDGDTAVYYQIDNWLGCIYSPPVEDMLAGASNQVHIMTIEPYHSDFDMWLISKAADFISRFILQAGKVLDTDGVAGKLEKFSDHFLYEQDYHDETVDLELLYNLDFCNSILIWQGHGGYIKEKGSLLSLGLEKWSQDDILIYQEEFSDGSLLLSSNGVIAVTAQFFKQHLNKGAMKNSLVYLNTCASLKDYGEDSSQISLAQAILDCGAICVIGNTDSVEIGYAYGMQDTIFDMLQCNQSDGSSTCITKAIKSATDIWGTSYNGSFVWAAGFDITLNSLLSEASNIDDIEFADFAPLSAADVTWIIEPEYNYQCVVPLRGSSFSDIEGDYSNGQTAIFGDVKDSWFDFYEMSFPSYSNLPQYYKIQLEDGSWRLYFMPDHSDSGDIPIDQGESNQNEYMTRGDASGILNDTAIVGLEKEKPSRYSDWPHYPYPWYLFTINNRGMGDMDIYYDVWTKQALAVGNFYDTVITSVKDAGLHKPYPSGRINTEKIDINNDEAMFLAQGTDLFNKFYDLVYPTIEEYPKGYVGTNGQPITDFVYTAAEDFSEGIAACSRNGKWGYINENGEEITDFIYDGVWISEYEMEYNDDLEKWEYFPIEYVSYPCTSDTMVVWLDGQVGLLYRDGQTLIAFGEFEDMAPAYNNELWAKKDGLWGLIDLADAKRKAGVSPALTVPAADIPDPEYIAYWEEEHPEVTPFDYPAKMGQIYGFYQDYDEFQCTSKDTTLYTGSDGEKEIITIPEGEVVQIFGIRQDHPGWLCVEWDMVVTQEGKNHIDYYFGWVKDEELISYLNSVSDSAYQDILEQYQTLCLLTENVWDSKEYYEDQYPEVNILAVSKYQRGSGNFYYAYYDINKDGVDELLIGQGQLQTGEITLTDILAYNGDSLISLNYFDGRAGAYIGDRATARICVDGTIILFNSNSAFHVHYQFFRVLYSGYKKTGKEYDQDTRERPDATFFDGSSYITTAQMKAILDEYYYFPDNTFEWVLLVEEKDDNSN